MQDTTEQMAQVLYDEDTDLLDENAVTRALIAAGFSTININVFREDAIDVTYEKLAHERLRFNGRKANDDDTNRV